jgi:hypothetical protein
MQDKDNDSRYDATVWTELEEGGGGAVMENHIGYNSRTDVAYG